MLMFFFWLGSAGGFNEILLTTTSSDNRTTPRVAGITAGQDEFADMSLKCNLGKNPKLTAANSQMKLLTRARVAGAIDSLVFNGKEFINSYDHGRQLQYAMSANLERECYNPTEAGSYRDGLGMFTTSRYVEGCNIADNKIYTKTQMAYWLGPGETGICAPGQTAVNKDRLSNYTVSKIVEVGYKGMDNVISFKAKVDVVEDLKAFSIEAPTGYLNGEFNTFYTYNAQTRKLTKLEQNSSVGGDPGDFLIPVKDIPIIATADGKYAMAAYSTDKHTYFVGYFNAFTSKKEAAEPTSKWTIVYRFGQTPKGVYSFESYGVVGTLDSVVADVKTLIKMHEPINLPVGAWEVKQSQTIVGWACDADSLSTNLLIKFYKHDAKLGKVYLGQTVADKNITYEDVLARCGGNPNKGFTFEIPNSVKTGNTEVIYAYAENIGIGPSTKMVSGYPIKVNIPNPNPAPTAPASYPDSFPDSYPASYPESSPNSYPASYPDSLEPSSPVTAF